MYTMKQARVGINLTQDEIASKLGLSGNTYRKYEKEPDKMPIRLAHLFCEICNLRFEDVIFYAHEVE